MDEPELLFSTLLGCDRLSLCLNRSARLDKDKSAQAAGVLRRRIRGEPLQYILGETEFMGIRFNVNPDVFIPRPETEILVEAVIRKVQSSGSILDLGTGSGCIAVSLAKSLRCSNITATDCSQKAIETAKENAVLNNVEVNFLVSDLFNHPGLRTKSYDLIVSNPPYIPNGEIDSLQPEIGFEPRIALEGGSDGLDFYREIIKQAPHFLKENGLLVMEMGMGQRNDLENIIKKSGGLNTTEVIKDYAGIERVIILQKKNG